MLYIQLYPFKLFHKLLSCLHLRKEILISLCDVFTGPVTKNLVRVQNLDLGPNLATKSLQN